MAITKSAKKALRQNRRHRVLNLARLKAVRDAVKAFRKAPSTNLLAATYARLDKAGKHHMIAKNRAARLKSRLSKLLAKPPKAKAR